MEKTCNLLYAGANSPSTLICVKDITKNVHNVYFMRDVFVAVMLAFIILLAFLYQPYLMQDLFKAVLRDLKVHPKSTEGDLDE